MGEIELLPRSRPTVLHGSTENGQVIEVDRLLACRVGVHEGAPVQVQGCDRCRRARQVAK